MVPSTGSATANAIKYSAQLSTSKVQYAARTEMLRKMVEASATSLPWYCSLLLSLECSRVLNTVILIDKKIWSKGLALGTLADRVKSVCKLSVSVTQLITGLRPNLNTRSCCSMLKQASKQIRCHACPSPRVFET